MREKVEDFKIGDWVEYEGNRMLVFKPEGSVCRIVDEDGGSDYFTDTYLKNGRCKYLPECDGWDWQPFTIEVGKFYELADGSIANATEKHRAMDSFLIGGFWYDQGCRVPPGYGSESIYSIVREVPAPVDLRKKFEEEWEKRHWCPVLENGSLRPITLVTGDTICTSIKNNKFSDRLSWSITWPDGSKIFTE